MVREGGEGVKEKGGHAGGREGGGCKQGSSSPPQNVCVCVCCARDNYYFGTAHDGSSNIVYSDKTSPDSLAEIFSRATT